MGSEPLVAANDGAATTRVVAAPPTGTPPTVGVPTSAPRNSASEVFDSVLRDGPELFKGDREILRETYIPTRLPHREHQIRQVVEILAPALKGNVPSNLLIYGKIGTGKTAVVAQVRADVQRRGELTRKLTFIAVNCGNVETPYSLMQTVGNTFATKEADRIPTGWSLDRVQAAMRDLMDVKGGIVLLILDEIDRLVARSGDGVLYTLCQVNTELDKARLVI
ncbi:MAG: AAA family ATPase, partial [Thermoplasmata archaeon]|nr:AAA family ATPase [Thermoplasmata archaeon]